MILGAEIAMLVIGIYALVTGKLTLSKKKVVQGTPARMIGIIGLLPLPLSFMAGVMYGATMAAQGKDFTTDKSAQWTMIGIEGGITLVAFLLILVLGFALG